VTAFRGLTSTSGLCGATENPFQRGKYLRMTTAHQDVAAGAHQQAVAGGSTRLTDAVGILAEGAQRLREADAFPGFDGRYTLARHAARRATEAVLWLCRPDLEPRHYTYAALAECSTGLREATQLFPRLVRPSLVTRELADQVYAAAAAFLAAAEARITQGWAEEDAR
jgi:hypothetical protein